MTGPKVVVMVSGGGRHLKHLLELERTGKLPVHIVSVIASKAGIGALDHAAAYGVPASVMNSELIADHLATTGAEWVVMAGWLRKWDIPNVWIGRTLNIHPSLLPLFGGKGFFGHHVHEAVLASGMRVSGCSVHFVTRDYDAGPLIVQRACHVEPFDSVATLANRVFAEELQALPEAIRLVVSNKAMLVDGKTVFSS